ncbi:MAG TPA: hypothetical protein VIK32_07460 [Candidatus Limnocylindrales bacterium]
MVVGTYRVEAHMSLILELRNRKTHAGTPLIHPTSEHVVLAEVFGIVKNLPFDAALNPWMDAVSHGTIGPSAEWTFSFWEKQPRPVGVVEGNTEVDLVMSSAQDLVFTEVKMDAAPSSGTASDPERNQLIRNLDIGHRRATKEAKRFSLIYITPDMQEPAGVSRIRSSEKPYPTDRIFWSSWGMIGDALAASVRSGALSTTERNFALDLLSYLSKKRLWQNTLEDDAAFYGDKLRLPLQATDSPFVPYADKSDDRDETWRSVDWDEDGLRQLLRGLRWEDKAFLKLLADAGGAMRQGRIMDTLRGLRGKGSGSLGALKSHVNAACRGCGKAPILSAGTGAGDQRLHEINPQLGPLRQIVIEEACAFVIPEGLH